MASGTGETVSCDFSDFPDYLNRIEQNQAIGIGITDKTEPFHVVAESLFKNQKNTITRTKDNFRFHSLVLFDVDSSEHGYEGVIKSFTEVFPEFSGCAKVISYSASSGICTKDGKPFSSGKGGLHIYCQISNPADVNRFADVLFKRAWLKGYGFVFISKSGHLLERTSLFDPYVFSPERLIFESAPVLSDLIQNRPQAFYIEGNSLDTSLLPNLTESEENLFKEMVEAGKEKKRPESERIRETDYIPST